MMGLTRLQLLRLVLLVPKAVPLASHYIAVDRKRSISSVCYSLTRLLRQRLARIEEF